MKQIYVVEEIRQRVEAVEADASGLPTRIKAVVQKADAVNRNHRIYPRATLEREIKRFNENEFRQPGLVDHPIDGYPSVADIGINWDRVWMEKDGTVWGEGALVPTSKGNDLRVAIAANVPVGISSRGYASADRKVVDGETVYVIADDYELETFDAVVDPSVSAARIKQAESVSRTTPIEKEEDMNENENEIVEETVVTDEEVAQAEAEAEIVEEIEAVVEETVGEEPVEEAAVTEVPQDDTVVNEALVAAEQRVSELEAALSEKDQALSEAVADAATLRQHAANLETLLSALVQAAHDALERDSFYAAADFANTAGEVSWLTRYLTYQADSSEADATAETADERPVDERVTEAVGKLLAEHAKSRLYPAIVEACREEKFGLLLVRRVAAEATNVEEIPALVEAKRTEIEAVLTARRSQVAPPKGVQEEPSAEAGEVDPELRAAYIAHEQLKLRGR